jgi:hypothetical protein
MTGNKDPTDLERRLRITGLWEERKNIPSDLRATERLSDQNAYSAKESASDEQIAFHYSLAAKDSIRTVCGYAFKLVYDAEAKLYSGKSVHQCVVGKLNQLREALPDYPMFGALLRHVSESRDYEELRQRISSLRREVTELFSGKSSVLHVLREKQKEVKAKQPAAPGAKRSADNIEQ